MGEGDWRLWLHLQHAAPGNERQARTPRGRVLPGGSRGAGRVRRRLEGVPHRALRRPAIVTGALAHPRASAVQAGADLHPGRG